jgi:hypothetical protein
MHLRRDSGAPGISSGRLGLNPASTGIESKLASGYYIPRCPFTSGYSQA